MKKIISVLALSMLVAVTSVSAQEKGRESFGNREKRPEFAQKMHDGDEQSRQAVAVGKRGRFMVNPEVRIDRQVRLMAEALDLTPEQAHRIKDIRMKQSKKELARYHRMEKRSEARMGKHKGAMNDLKAVLTPEQLKKWDEMREKGPGFRKGASGKGAFGAPEKQFGTARS